MKYFRQLSRQVKRLRCSLGVGILQSNSCTRPKGQPQPQIRRAKINAKSRIKPSTQKGMRKNTPLSELCSEPSGQAPKAPGQEQQFKPGRQIFLLLPFQILPSVKPAKLPLYRRAVQICTSLRLTNADTLQTNCRCLAPDGKIFSVADTIRQHGGSAQKD